MGYRSSVDLYVEFGGEETKKKLEQFRKDFDLEDEMEIGNGYFELNAYSWKMYADDVEPMFRALAQIVDFIADVRGEELRDVWQIKGDKGKLFVINANEEESEVPTGCSLTDSL